MSSTGPKIVRVRILIVAIFLVYGICRGPRLGLLAAMRVKYRKVKVRTLPEPV